MQLDSFGCLFNWYLCLSLHFGEQQTCVFLLGVKVVAQIIQEINDLLGIANRAELSAVMLLPRITM